MEHSSLSPGAIPAPGDAAQPAWEPDSTAPPSWVEDWMRETVGDRFVAPGTLQRVGAGQSNITYRFADAAGHSWVLRRPPSGAHGTTAHDVLREARILTALSATDIPVPTVIGTRAADERGPAFYVMDDVPGWVIETEPDAEQSAAGQRVAISHEIIDTLTALHAVDPDEIGLGDLGAREDYVGRQIRRLTRNWDAWGRDSASGAAWQALLGRLQDVPWPAVRPTIVHGDFRLSNMILSGGKVRAVLDWELTALGDPLADLAWLLDDWREPGEPRIAFPTPTSIGGFAPRQELASRYQQRTGRDLGQLSAYQALTHWKAATLAQGVLQRRRTGQLGRHGAMNLHDLETTISLLLEEGLDLLASVSRCG